MYDIIMWRGAERSTSNFPAFCEGGYNTIKLFNALPEEYRPNYLVASSKQMAEEMIWDYDYFRDLLLEKGRVSEGEAPSELGYSMGWFSSMNEEESFGYSLRIGNTKPLFANSLVVNISSLYDMRDKRNAELMKEIFIQAVQQFRPYWGFFGSRELEDFRIPRFGNRVPQPMRGLNYYSGETRRLIRKQLKSFLKNAYNAYWEEHILVLP